MDIIEKLDQIEIIIKDPNFIENKGLGNEVGYYIFDYPPRYELRVRNYIKEIKSRNNINRDGLEIVIYDVYDIMIDLIEEENLIEDCIEFEKNETIEYLVESVNGLMNMDRDRNYFVDYVENNTPEKAVVFIIGVGKIFPFVRSHKILNSLHQMFDRLPVVLFFPGKYDSQELTLFELFKDDNYYRAFPLVR